MNENLKKFSLPGACYRLWNHFGRTETLYGPLHARVRALLLDRGSVYMRGWKLLLEGVLGHFGPDLDLGGIRDGTTLFPHSPQVQGPPRLRSQLHLALAHLQIHDRMSQNVQVCECTCGYLCKRAC